LHGIPWRLAFALQDDGWYLRADVIWNKPNAMPESVKDRPTRRAVRRSLLTLLRDRESDPATRVRKSNASPGACAVAGPFAFFALFAVENLADCRGGLRAAGPGVTVRYRRRGKED
jgi:hypothetical protein